ncbi:MAG: hypothetical protein HYT46_00875 [Candidatus Vogelbacteria bacterium]|nr:hypothetical protein [Candidatus Vogelbacteria bacterium]
MGEERYLSVRTVAAKHKFSPAKLIAACRQQRLAAREFGGEWYISESAVPFCRTLDETATMFDWRHPLLRPLAVLVLLVSITAATASLGQIRTWQYFAAGARLTAAVIGQSFVSVTRSVKSDQPAAVFSAVEGDLIRLWFVISDFWQTLAANFNYGWRKMADAWSGFLGQTPSPPPATSAGEQPVLDPALISQLKAEIKEELARELLKAGVVPNRNSPGTGLVVLPSSGNPAVDRVLAEELEQAFSDQVEVRFDASGQTGLVTPIFPSGRGDDYLFVITPIKKQTPPTP